MRPERNHLSLWLWAGIVVGGLLPLLVFWPAFQPSAAGGAPVVRDISLFEQWLVVLTAFGVKPAYMVLSLVLILWLRGQTARDLVALRWGLVAFLAGELACAANYLAFRGGSALADYLHSYGMAVGFSFVAYAALEGLDVRVIKYSAPRDRCAALGLCRSCIKHADVPCALRRLFAFLIPALIVVALMLPAAGLSVTACQTCVLDSDQIFGNPLWSQLFEGRYCAAVAVVLLAISWAILQFKRDEPVAMAKLFMAAGLGPLAFGLLRLFLRTAYAQNLAWANIWEETTELLFVVGVGLVLWLFRQGLFKGPPAVG